MEQEVDALYLLLEKSKCVSYYDSFKELGITLDDLILLEKEDLSNTIKEPLLCALFWRNLVIFKEQKQKEKEIECSGFQIEESGYEDNSRKRKAKGLLLEERLSKKQHIVLRDVSLNNLPTEKPTDSDYKKISEQILNHLKKTNVTKLRHGQLDGLCGYLICKYPILDEKKYSGYEIMKSKIINVLRNYRSFEKKKMKTDETNGNEKEASHDQQQPQYILCISQN